MLAAAKGPHGSNMSHEAQANSPYLASKSLMPCTPHKEACKTQFPDAIQLSFPGGLGTELVVALQSDVFTKPTQTQQT